MDTAYYPGPMKEPDTHSPAYLQAKASRVARMREQILKLTERLKEIEEEEYGIPISRESKDDRGSQSTSTQDQKESS